MTKRTFIPWPQRLRRQAIKAAASTTRRVKRFPAPPSESSENARIIAKQDFFTRQGLRRGARHATPA